MTKQAQVLMLGALDTLEKTLEEGRDEQGSLREPDSLRSTVTPITEEILKLIKVTKVRMKTAESSRESSSLASSSAPSSAASVAPSGASFIPENPSACQLIQNMFMDESTADVVFQVGDKLGRNSPATFYAHGFILK